MSTDTSRSRQHLRCTSRIDREEHPAWWIVLGGLSLFVAIEILCGIIDHIGRLSR